LTYLSPSKSAAHRKELEGLAQSLRRTLERIEAVRAFAVKEGGDADGTKVTEVLAGVARSVKKAISISERPK